MWEQMEGWWGFMIGRYACMHLICLSNAFSCQSSIRTISSASGKFLLCVCDVCVVEDGMPSRTNPAFALSEPAEVRGVTFHTLACPGDCVCILGMHSFS